MNSLSIRLAGPDDAPVILDILNEAVHWLAAKGLDQWQWPDQFTAERTSAHINRGEVYLAYLQNVAVATLALQWSDPHIWGELDGDAGYLHRLAVRRAYAGRGFGRELLDWASGEVAAAGKRYLRLDCDATNPGLCDYYQTLGFAYRGESGGEWRGYPWRAALYERLANMHSLSSSR